MMPPSIGIAAEFCPIAPLPHCYGTSGEIKTHLANSEDLDAWQISAILRNHGITLPTTLFGINHGKELLTTLQILEKTETGVAMLNKIGELLNDSSSEFAKNIAALKFSTETGPNTGSLLELIDGVLTTNLNFEEIKGAKDLYLVKNESGQLRFIFVNNPPLVTLGHEFGHGIQMLSLGTAELNQGLEQNYNDKIMNSLGKCVLKTVESLIPNDVKEFERCEPGTDDPMHENLSKWMYSLIKKPCLQRIKSELEAINQTYAFLLTIWNGGEYADLFNILPKVGVANAEIQWSDEQLLKEMEQLRSEENTDFMPSYFEIDEENSNSIPSPGMGNALNKAAGTMPVRFGHRPIDVEKFNKYSSQYKAYVWEFMQILLEAFGVKSNQLPTVSNSHENFSQGKRCIPA